MKRLEIENALRVKQQGEGRPIVAAQLDGFQLVASGSKIHYSKKWVTFSDFLFDNVYRVFGADWFKAEIEKPEHERHTLVSWQQKLLNYQKTLTKISGLYTAKMNGLALCYLGLAYNLYLIEHNVELQSRLVARLKNQGQFQGAYYELIVANCLVRAGFELVLEDETDGESGKHCEFSALSKTTNRKFWVEAKMRSVAGYFGKKPDESSRSSDPTSKVVNHLNKSLAKPAPDERMIFIDVNAPPSEDASMPAWMEKAAKKVERRERSAVEEETAYVFLTNFSFHQALYSETVFGAAIALGFGIPDFGKVGPIRPRDWYLSKQKHMDAFCVMDALRKYPQIPDTFDGAPASVSRSQSGSFRILLGETYFFEDVGTNGVIGKVDSVAVSEKERQAYLSICTPSGNGMILTSPMSDEELGDFEKYGYELFGEMRNSNTKAKDETEFYEWLVETHMEYDTSQILKNARNRPDFERLSSLDHEELVLEYCEGVLAEILSRNEANSEAKKRRQNHEKF